jgi:hypothetical protein
MLTLLHNNDNYNYNYNYNYYYSCTIMVRIGDLCPMSCNRSDVIFRVCPPMHSGWRWNLYGIPVRIASARKVSDDGGQDVTHAKWENHRNASTLSGGLGLAMTAAPHVINPAGGLT